MVSGAYCLGLYEKAMPGTMSFGEMLDETARGGFDALEISIDESELRLSRLGWGSAERRRILRRSLDAGVPIATMCLSGHRRFPLGSRDAAQRAHGMEIFRKALELAADLNVRIIQLAGYDVYYEQGGADTVVNFGENIALCAQAAAGAGVLLGFETMETPFMDTVGKAMKWVNAVGSPYLGLYPDIGNLKNAAVRYGTDLTADMLLGAGHTLAAHLKETRPGVYRNMSFGTGHTPYSSCIGTLYGMGVRRFTGEFWYADGTELRHSLSEASRFLRREIEAVVRM